MASDRQLFKRAKIKWESLRDAGNLSLSAELGKTAIISSLFTDEPPDTETGITELEAFRSEAFELAKRIQANRGKTELAIDATRSDITDLIQDPEVATMYMIGNGSLSNLIIDERDYYDWLNVSVATTHLKQGDFVQRQCGGLTRALNAPLGLFAVSDHRNVHAAFDDEFYPLSLDDPVNEKIRPVFDTPHVSYGTVKALGSTVI